MRNLRAVSNSVRVRWMGFSRTALDQVLETLVALHAAGWMHRDLRWGNIMKRRDVDNEWFLIDFVDAAQIPKVNSRSEALNMHDHAPEMFVKGESHTTAVDVWGVGALINTCKIDGEPWWGSKERMDFQLQLMSTDPAQRPSAADALATLRDLAKSTTRSQMK